MHSDRARSGFTLVELAVVLAILGLVAGIAAPRYAAAAARYRLKAAAHRIGADLGQARTAARASSKSVSLIFTLTHPAHYRITGGDGLVSDTAVMLGTDPYRVRVGMADFGGASFVTFDGYGNGVDGDVTVASGSLSGTIHFDNASGATTVVIEGK